VVKQSGSFGTCGLRERGPLEVSKAAWNAHGFPKQNAATMGTLKAFSMNTEDLQIPCEFAVYGTVRTVMEYNAVILGMALGGIFPHKENHESI
jgi:hypothetical protein